VFLLLTHAYFLCDDPKEKKIMKPYPPLGLLYLAAWLDQHEVENTVWDSTFATFEDQKKFLLQHQPAIVALYANLMTKVRLLELVAFMRHTPTLRDTLVILGGPDVTFNTAEYLAEGADALVLGEGEQTLLELAECVAGYGDDRSYWHTIPGLAFRLPDNTIHHTPPRSKIKDLELLPLPARYKIDLQQYLDVWKQAHGKSTISISTQRGCPYTCRWCSTAVYGQSYRRRSPEAVADEMALLQQQYLFDAIWFVDDVFTVSHKWLYQFQEVLAQKNLRIPFECITRADRLDEEILQVLYECGCHRVWIGAESGSQRILDAMDRRVEAIQAQNMMQAARRAGIETGTFIMLGYPGETEVDIVETVRHLRRGNPDFFTITVAYPIKGTKLYETVAPSLLSPDKPWAQRTDRDLDFVRTYPRHYYPFAVRWVVNADRWHQLKMQGKVWSAHGLRAGIKMTAARIAMRLIRPLRD
jgi:radical SAM superfamily enzyme YgiQ (UPF0313 family)